MKSEDKKEKELFESYERGEWKTIPKNKHKAYFKAARNSISKNKRINIRLTTKDYYDIQLKAIEEGIPY